jgi:hypothetical protein
MEVKKLAEFCVNGILFHGHPGVHLVEKTLKIVFIVNICLFFKNALAD